MVNLEYGIGIVTSVTGTAEVEKLNAALNSTKATAASTQVTFEKWNTNLKTSQESIKGFRMTTAQTSEELRVTGREMRTINAVTKEHGVVSGTARKNLEKYSQIFGGLSTTTTDFTESNSKLVSTFDEQSTATSSTIRTNQLLNTSLKESNDQAEKFIAADTARAKGAAASDKVRADSIRSALTSAQKYGETTTDTQNYLNTLIRGSSKDYKELTDKISETGKAGDIANRIQTEGNKMVTGQLKDELNQRMKTINQIEKSGVVVDASTKAQMEATKKLNESLKGQIPVWGALKQVGQTVLGTIKKIGLTFLTLIGPLFLVGAAMRTIGQVVSWATQPFLNFENAMYELRKTANLTFAEMGKVGTEVLRLSLRIPIAADELMKMAAIAGQVGIRGADNILRFTEVVAKLSIATSMSAQEAANALAKLSAAFEIPINSIENLASVINQLENTTAATAEGIVSAMERIGASGKLLGFTAEQAAAMAATLIDMGMRSERAGTRIRSVLSQLAVKSSQIESDMGVGFKGWAETLSKYPMKALLQYLKYLHDIEDPVERMATAHKQMGSVAGFAVSSLAQNYDDLNANLITSEREMRYNISLTDEYAVAITKTSSALELAANRAVAARRAFGEEMIPVLVKAKNAWADLLWWLSGSNYALEIGKKAGQDHISTISDLVTQYDTLKGSLPTLEELAKRERNLNKERMKRPVAIPYGEETYGISYEEQLRNSNEYWNAEQEKLISYRRGYLVLDQENKEINSRMYSRAGKILNIYDETKMPLVAIHKEEERLSGLETERVNAAQLLSYLSQDEVKNKDEIASVSRFISAKEGEIANLQEFITAEVFRKADADKDSLAFSRENRDILRDSVEEYSKARGIRLEFTKTQRVENALLAKSGSFYDELKKVIADSYTGGISGQEEYIENQLNLLTTGDSVLNYLDDLKYKVSFAGSELHIVSTRIDKDYKTILEDLKKLQSTDPTEFKNLWSGALFDLQEAEGRLIKTSGELIDSVESLSSSYKTAFGAHRTITEITNDIADAQKRVGKNTKITEKDLDSLATTIERYKNLPSSFDFSGLLDIGDFEKRLADQTSVYAGQIIATYTDEKKQLQELATARQKIDKDDTVALAQNSADMYAIIESLYSQWYTTAMSQTTKTGQDALDIVGNYLDSMVGEFKAVGITIPTIKFQYEEATGDYKAIIEGNADESVKSLADLEAEYTEITNEAISKFGKDVVDTWAETFAKGIIDVTKAEAITLNIDEDGTVKAITDAIDKGSPYTVTVKPEFLGTAIGFINLGMPAPIEGEDQFGGSILKTGLYKLHQGEKVISRGVTQQQTSSKESKEFNFNFNFPVGVPQTGRKEIEEIIRTTVYKAVREFS